MRVLYFHQYFSTRKGSVGTRSYEMAKKLLECGHEVTMVCGSYGPADTGLSAPFTRGRREGTVEGIRVIEFEIPFSNNDSLLKRSGNFLKYSWRSAWTALREPADLVFATSTPLTAAIPGLAARWLRRRKFVFEVRDLWPELPKAMGVVTNPVVLWALAWLEKRAYRTSQHCIGLAPGIVDGIAKHIDRARVTLIPNGCDLDLQQSAEGNLWRPEGVSTEDFMAIFSGTHGPANGLHAVLDAALELERRGRNDIKIVLVGGGKQKAELVERARQESIRNVIFHDHVPKEKLTGLLASANCGLQILDNVPAFYFGTSPNKFFDYLSMGLPVLVNYPGWVANLVRENGCGHAVEPENPSAFTDALEAMADDRQSCQEFGTNSRKLAETEFAREMLAERFVRTLEAASTQ